MLKELTHLCLKGTLENSVDPDQMPHSAVSDWDLHCLPVSLLSDTRHDLGLHYSH